MQRDTTITALLSPIMTAASIAALGGAAMCLGFLLAPVDPQPQQPAATMAVEARGGEQFYRSPREAEMRRHQDERATVWNVAPPTRF